MRGAPWFACLVVLLVVLAAIPFVANADAGPGPREASPVESGRPRITEAQGEAVFRFSGACLDNASTCIGDRRVEEGTFFLPASGIDGLVTVSWRPANDSLRALRVRVAGMELVGESPLRFVVPGLAAGEHRVSVAPTARLLGSYEQRVDWTAVFSLDLAQLQVVAHGAAEYRLSASCVLRTCHGLAEQTSDELVVPWTGIGSLTATWRPEQGAHIVCIRGTERCAQGDTPLSLALDGLPAGSYRIDARPAGGGSEISSGKIDWGAMLTPA